LTEHTELTNGTSDPDYDANNVVYELPEGYYKYIRSVSDVTGTYKSGLEHTKASNVLIKQVDANKVINQYYDKNRILRNPVVILEKGNTARGRLKVIHDAYTTINSVDLTYLRLPGDFSILTGVACELPYTCFEELVSGATDLYVRHLTATQPKQQPKK
jgi:hypothetical protein